MTTDNQQMWADLGIDLERHDALLNAIAPIYEEIYLYQKTRCKCAEFFDLEIKTLGIVLNS